MNKKYILVITVIAVLGISSFFYLNNYSQKFADNLYFCKKYEKTDDEYLSSAMYGDVIMFDKKHITIITVADLDKIRAESKEKKLNADSLGWVDFLPKVKYHALAYEYGNIKYNYFAKTVSADEMENINVLDNDTIEYKGQTYSKEKDLEKVFYNGKIPSGKITIVKPLF